MIPKIIHYCWFGRTQKSELARQCMSTWKPLLPDYEFIEWNEENFNLNMNEYTKEAYENKKYAFVSDVARLYALFNYGGIYLDTDVELLKSLDPFLNHTAFCGMESDSNISTAMIGAEKGSVWIGDCLQLYDHRHFVKQDGTFDYTTNVTAISRLLRNKLNIELDNSFHDYIGYLSIYPSSYFSPLDFKTRLLCKTNSTVSIHHFDGSWLRPIVEEPGLIDNLRIRFALRTRLKKLIQNIRWNH